MKTNTSIEYKLNILHKVAEKILQENGFRFTTTGKNYKIYENDETSCALSIERRNGAVIITNLCRGNIPIGGPLMRSLLRDRRFVISEYCPLMLYSDLSHSLDELWDSVSHYLSHEETAEIFQCDRLAKLAAEERRRKPDLDERELVPPVRPIPVEEFI